MSKVAFSADLFAQELDFLLEAAREVRASEMTLTTAVRTRRGQPRGNGREWDKVGGMSRLPEKR